MTTIPPDPEAILSMTTIWAEMYVAKDRDERTARTCLSLVRGIVEVLPNKPFYVLVTMLTMKAVAVPKLSRLAEFTKRLIEVVSMVEDTGQSLRDV